jgi:hypothetical protein
MDEEKRRLQATREEVGDASGGERIDFGSGKVVIRRKPKEQRDDTDDGSEEGAEPESDPTDSGSTDSGSTDSGSADSGARADASPAPDRALAGDEDPTAT